ncbi:MAG: Endoribonuclease Nob1 [Candidatus Heimdallarchaeota archaeon LC_2]|nr:MAG: Endoribonuclease Nob1 [Candidatus Heimdallarchaeota archaeon LC_2]
MNLNYLPEIVGEIYTSNSAVSELKSQISKNIFNMFKSQNKLTIVDPEGKERKIVINTINKIGQLSLSDPDIDILAIALKLNEIENVLIYSDDYGLRNVAHQLKLQSTGVKTTGGDTLRKFKYICKACSASYNQKIDECNVCGHTNFLRRRRRNK